MNQNYRRRRKLKEAILYLYLLVSARKLFNLEISKALKFMPASNLLFRIAQFDEGVLPAPYML